MPLKVYNLAMSQKNQDSLFLTRVVISTPGLLWFNVGWIVDDRKPDERQDSTFNIGLARNIKELFKFRTY